MGEGFRNDPALRLLLQAVIADGRSGIQRLLDFTRFDDVLCLVGTVSPDAGKTVGLQLKPYRQRVCLGLAGALLCLMHLVRDAKQILHVMSDFVGDHVGLGKLARRMEALLQLSLIHI